MYGEDNNMWGFLISLVCFVSECIKIYIAYHKIIGIELIKKKSLRYCIMIIGVVLAVISIIWINKYSVFLNAAILFLLTITLFSGNVWKKSFMFFSLYSLICLLDMWFNSMQEILIPSSGRSIFAGKVIESFISAITIIILLLIARVKMKYLSVQLSKRLIWYQGMILAGVIIISCIFMGYSQVVLQDSSSWVNRVLNFVFACAWMALVFMVVILIYTIIVKEQYKLLIEVNEKVLVSQQQYYKMVLEKDENLRKFRHDYRSHVSAIKMFAHQEDYNGIITYIEDMENASAAFSVDINTGNMIVDAIINDTILKYKEFGIEFEIRGMLPEKLMISNMDITTIFSNAILNAVEATVKCPSGRKVRIVFKRIKERCIIEMQNPIIEDLSIEEGVIITTKSDKENHGFGIINIENCLKKYNGFLEFERKYNDIYTRIII